jgi:hypothetical protein
MTADHDDPFGDETDAWVKNCLSLREDGWATFTEATSTIENYLDVAAGVAERMVREARASGDVRSQQLICDEKLGWIPVPIKPSEWLEDQMDLKWLTRKDVLSVLYAGLEDEEVPEGSLPSRLHFSEGFNTGIVADLLG